MSPVSILAYTQIISKNCKGHISYVTNRNVNKPLLLIATNKGGALLTNLIAFFSIAIRSKISIKLDATTQST